MNANTELAPLAHREIAVCDTASYREASAYLLQLKRYRQQVTDYWEQDIKTAYHHHRSLVAKRDALLEVAAHEESNTKYNLLQYKLAEDRRVADEQARVDAIARQAAADRALADAVALEQHAQEAETPALASMAASMISDQYIDQEFAATRHVVPSTVPKIPGISTPTRLVVELANKRSMVLAIAAGAMLELAGTDPAVTAFLRGFHPVRDGLHLLDVNLPAVRREATNKMKDGGTFSLPGIIAERRQDIR